MASDLQKSSVAEEITIDCPPTAPLKEFNRFDIVTDCSDHHFLHKNNPKKDGLSCDPLKIMQEWKILEKNLPDSIYVRVYEERMDLLRAVIVGAAGTPYHDSLFFFDLAFPSNYPSKPPKVHYHSHNLHLNPNLYAGGYVCLSLLNTWSGNKRQKWIPAESTILQVLISLQALVLNEKPYFNEPGVRPGGQILERASMSYSEDVFLLSCKTMLYSLANPPKNFEYFVAQHFRQRADIILAACKAYIEGRARVGYFHVDEGPSSAVIEVSRKFKESMDKIYQDLDAAFARNAVSVVSCPELSRKPFNVKRTAVKKKKYKIRMNFLGKMKWILGWSKIGKKWKKNAVSTKSGDH